VAWQKSGPETRGCLEFQDTARSEGDDRNLLTLREKGQKKGKQGKKKRKKTPPQWNEKKGKTITVVGRKVLW